MSDAVNAIKRLTFVSKLQYILDEKIVVVEDKSGLEEHFDHPVFASDDDIKIYQIQKQHDTSMSVSKERCPAPDDNCLLMIILEEGDTRYWRSSVVETKPGGVWTMTRQIVVK